jgi:DNA-binding transcriptional LysR family regulator
MPEIRIIRSCICMDAERWADLEILTHIAGLGTLSAAARALGVNQTTVARRLKALERRIGTALFDRVDGRHVPTPALETALGRLRAMSEEASLAVAALKRAKAEVQGNVRVTSIGFILARVLAPSLGVFAARHPGIVLDFVADDQALSFTRREADIALRFGRTAEDTTLVRKIGAIRFRLYRPAHLASGGDLPVIRYGNALAHVAEMQALEKARPAARVAFTANKLDIVAEAALSMGAEAMLPERFARDDPRFAVAPGEPVFADRHAWLMIHPERARVPSVSFAAAWVEETVRDWVRSRNA